MAEIERRTDASDNSREESASHELVRQRKTNSERGKAFRAKRRHHEVLLLELISSLRKDVRDLRFLRELREGTALMSRSSLEGSLVRLVREYFSLFAAGRPTQPRSADDTALVATQEAFLQQSTDPLLNFGTGVGAVALLDQWERYTTYHARFQITVESVSVAGSAEAPIITVRSSLHVTLSRDTFKYIFPHIAANEELMSRHVGREVTYYGVNQFQFSEDGKRIVVYNSDVDFVNAFLAAGIGLTDVALLMQQARIAGHYILGEDPKPIECPSPPLSEPEDDPASTSKRARQVTIQDLLNDNQEEEYSS